MLSFLIPAYNCEDVLDAAVASALAQDLGVDTEVVIVDDGSTDSTVQCARAWETRCPGRVRLGLHQHNRGGAAARNTAADIASGDLLYMLDADNVLTEGCVSSQLELMQKTGLHAISVGQFYYFEGSTANVIDGWVLRHSGGISTLRDVFATSKVPPSHGNYLYTRQLFDAVEGYSENSGAMDAWTFGMKHLARGFDIGIDPNSHYMHRLNRPDRESYWSREERLGTNDANAIRALRREVDRLPDELRALVMTLAPRDRFFALVAAGAFCSDPAHLRSIRRVERAERTALIGFRSALELATRARSRLTGR